MAGNPLLIRCRALMEEVRMELGPIAGHQWIVRHTPLMARNIGQAERKWALDKHRKEAVDDGHTG